MLVLPQADADELAGEVVRLRTALVEERVASVRALARATRLSQLVTALGQVVDVSEVFDRAVCEVAELFGADIAVVCAPEPADGERWRMIASWGLGLGGAEVCAPLRGGQWPTQASPVVAGAAADFEIPGWLAAYAPKHLTWGLLSVRDDQPGYLLLVRRADLAFDNADVQELTAVMSRIALAVDNGRLYQRTQEQLRHSQLLHEVTADLARCLEADAVAERLVAAVVAHVPVASARVSRTAEGFESGFELALRLGGEQSRVGTLVVTGAPAPGSGARNFLQHLAEVGGLAMEKALLFEWIRGQAETDALTGLPNRVLFRRRLVAAVERCRDAGTDLSVLFIDLDGFKAVNDVHGHEIGDRLLKQVAARLSAAIGDGDSCARLGGDEFVVITEGGNGLAGRLQEVMDEPFVVESIRLRVGGSVGVGTAAASGYDADVLLRDADAAMYRAKRARKAVLLNGFPGATVPKER